MYSIILVYRLALNPPHHHHHNHKHLLMIMCIIVSVFEFTLLVSLEAFVMTEVSETVSGRQPRQGVKQRIFIP